MVNFSSRAVLALFVLLSFSSVYAQNKVVVIPLDSTPGPIKYAIGDIGPAGGVVFHVTNGGLNGLEAAPVDQGTAPWNCFETNVAGVDIIASAGTPDSNSGAVNTPLIALACPGDAVSAAVRAAVYVWPNGQRDGFLPNKEELDLLYDQKVAGVVRSFASDFYWSSSESPLPGAWSQLFFDGNQLDYSIETDAYGVRAVRAF